MSHLIFENESYKIRGACYEVYREKGNGYLEAVYQDCLSIEFELQGIPYVQQAPLSLSYKGRRLNHSYVADFLCYKKIIVELKAAKSIADEHRAQMINYLKSSGMKLGLLVNFGAQPQIEIERFVFDGQETVEDRDR